MEEVEKAESLLKIITKQRFSDSIVKSELVSLGFLTEKGNVDAKGKWFVHSYFMDLLRERNELAAQVERLRGAAIALLMNRMGMDEWYALESALKETQAQSLDAVKREAALERINAAMDYASTRFGCYDVAENYGDAILEFLKR